MFKGEKMKIAFFSWRKCKITKFNEVLEGTKELRKIMGWNGLEGSAILHSPGDNLNNLSAHYRRFNSVEEMNDYYEDLRKNKFSEVMSKISDINENCVAYWNSRVEILEPIEGIDVKDTDYSYLMWHRWKAKRGHIADLVDLLRDMREKMEGSKPNIIKPISGDMQYISMVKPIKTLTEVPSFDQARERLEKNKSLVQKLQDFTETHERYFPALIRD